MKKLFIAGSKYCYEYIPDIEKRLNQMGYEVILPNCFDDPFLEERIKKDMTRNEHVEFCRNAFKESMEKAKESDAILVVNMDKEKDGKVYPNYIGGATFLEIYDSYLLNHPIFLYNDIPNNMLYDEIEGMNPTVLNRDLFTILENDDFSFISDSNNLLKYFSKNDLDKIKECDDLYLKASLIVRKVFNDKVDKSNKPYIGHLKRVSDSLDNYNQIVAGLLHDIVEDTDITCKDLLEVGFSKEIVRIVFIVTKPIVDTSKMTENEKLALYESEINSIINSNNYDAIRLKEADMEDNCNRERLSLLTKDEQVWFKKKYEKQLIKLIKINEKRR